MALHTLFTHGSAVVAENAGGANVSSPGPLTNVNGIAWTDVLGLPQGFGKTYRGKSGSRVWFHAAVPTPAQIGSQIVALNEVYILALLGGGARLTAVHVWDGGSNINRINDLSLTGDLRGNLVSGRNVFGVRNPDGSYHRMVLGLCVCMHIQFDSEADVRFDSVGASFHSPL